MNLQFLPMMTLIYKIFSISHYDIKNNIKNWFYLLSIQTLILSVLSLCSFLPGSFIFSLPDMFLGSENFQFILSEEYFSLSWSMLSFLMCTKVIIAMITEILLRIVFPIMIIQNALDLAFDSTMRGFTIKGQVLLYVMVGYIFYFFKDMILGDGEMLIQYLLEVSNFTEYVAYGLYVIIVMILLLLYCYLFQSLRFVGLHIFEYQAGLKESILASWYMTRGKIMFLSIIALTQTIIIVAMTFLYLGFTSLVRDNIGQIDKFSFVFESLSTVFLLLFWSYFL